MGCLAALRGVLAPSQVLGPGPQSPSMPATVREPGVGFPTTARASAAFAHRVWSSAAWESSRQERFPGRELSELPWCPIANERIRVGTDDRALGTRSSRPLSVEFGEVAFLHGVRHILECVMGDLV